MKSNKKGVIYILTNPSFPEYVKIGYATDIEERLKQLNSSETVPYAFRVYATYDVEQELTDKKLHKLIDTINPELRAIETFGGKQRVKEFYAMSAENAYTLLDCIAQISGTQDCLKLSSMKEHEIRDEKIAIEIRETGRRPKFRFSNYNIPAGSTLCFIGDENITASVLDDTHIEYKGKRTTLSALAQKLTGNSSPLQGTLYFTYKGQKLTEIRENFEKQQYATV